MSQRMWWRCAAVSAGAALALAACAPGSGSSGGSGTDDDTSPSDDGAAGSSTLTVWDQEVRGGQDEQMSRLNEAFEEEYGVEINRNSQSFDDLATTLRGALTGSEAPDVVQANNTRGDMGAFVSAGLLLDLTDYAAEYGWADRYDESVLAMSSYSEDGTEFGSGNLYGLPQTGEVVGVFYSRDAAKEYGIDVDSLATWEDFTDSLAEIAGADGTALMLGNIDGWPAAHVFGPIQGQYVDPEEIANLAMGNAGASWQTDENLIAAAELQKWVTSGYFNEGPNGTDYDAAWADFADGGAVYLIGGSWLAADLEEAMGEDVGFFAPPAPEGRELATTGGTGLPFAITADSPNADLAAQYLNFITSDDAMEILAETGNMPVNRTADLAPDSGVNAEVFAAFGEVTTEGHLLPYLDWATPTMGDTIGAGLQDLIGEQTTPEAFLETLQADYGEFTSN